ncbi:ferredoxin reductase [Pseudoxanthomonas japonensis]|nr:ferredoxin reductase [Pseudoxanthomonas japonensis]
MNARVLPAARRPSGALRRLISPLVAPDVFDFWAGRLNRNWTWDRPRARLVAREDAAKGAVTLWLRPNRHWAGFRPGQHVNLGVDIGGVRHTRSYSLTEPPRADGLLAITVKAIEAGRVSQYLYGQARAGEVFELGPAFGELCLPAHPEGGWLFLAAGSGITPLMALTRQLAAQGMPVDLDLAYWARTREELCFLDELRALAIRHPRFRVHLGLTGEAAREADEQAGRIDGDWLDARIPALAGRRAMACGPGGFVETARRLLEGRVAGFQAEAFSPPPNAIEDSGEVEVHLTRSGRRLQVARGQSLLVALEEAGLKPESGCRMGICNTCACGKATGATRHLPSGALAQEPTQALKLCINSAVTDLELDL